MFLGRALNAVLSPQPNFYWGLLELIDVGAASSVLCVRRPRACCRCFFFFRARLLEERIGWGLILEGGLR